MLGNKPSQMFSLNLAVLCSDCSNRKIHQTNVIEIFYLMYPYLYEWTYVYKQTVRLWEMKRNTKNCHLRIINKFEVNLCNNPMNLARYYVYKGIARTQSPTIKNYAFELPTFGVIVGVSPAVVQWKGLTLEEPPSWSRLTSTPGKYA